MRSLRSGALTALGLVAIATTAMAKDKPAGLPETDPPAVLGEAYVADGVTHLPVDAPFDDVGYAGLDEGAGPGVSVAHRTLPLPSYVEVTALGSGRTILARVERRGPPSGKQLVALSSAAFAQLAENPAIPLAVRVRRVNPQEYERALLRTNQRAPERLVTPGPLVEVLRKLLAAKGSRVPVAVTDPSLDDPEPAAVAAKPAPVKGVAPKPAPAKVAAANAKVAIAKPTPPKVTPPQPAASSDGTGFAVQVASFASRPNADATARKLGAKVTGSGQLWRVRLGPYAKRAAAESALARARNAGFSDARIVSAGK